MDQEQQKSVLTICLMAAFADGAKSDQEREQIKRIAEGLTSAGVINVAAIYQDVLFKRVSLAQAAASLTRPEARQLAYEMAVCVCDADGAQSDAERGFLLELRTAMSLDAVRAETYSKQVDGVADVPLAPAVATASSLSAEEIDKIILKAAITNGALELLPESLSTLAIIPLQMKLVYRIGKAYGFELDRGHVKDFLATAGVGLASQYLEQAGRKLIGGLLGGLLGGAGRQAVSSGMSFASTYALGYVAKRYYGGGRTLTTEMLKAAYSDVLGEARNLQSRYLPQMQAQARDLNVARVMDLVRGS